MTISVGNVTVQFIKSNTAKTKMKMVVEFFRSFLEYTKKTMTLPGIPMTNSRLVYINP